MKKTTMMLCLAACFAAADTKITWLADVTADRAETVTGAQSNSIAAAAAHIPRTDNPHNVTAPQIGALTVEVDPVSGPRIDRIEAGTNAWQTAYSWGNHALVGYLLPAALAPYATTAALVVHTNRVDNPHNVTASQIGAITNELDLAALRAYHYGDPDIIESPEEWFTFNPATKTITGFNWDEGREHVVIPWAIGGVPVVGIAGFLNWDGNGVVSIITPKSVIAVNNSLNECTALTTVDLPNATTLIGSFQSCYALTSVDLPNVTTLNYSLQYCDALTSVTFSGSPPAFDEDTFVGSANAVVYVDNPHATGWGETFGGRPVVRLPVTADSYTLNGQTITEWPTAPVQSVNDKIGAVVITAGELGALTQESDPVALPLLATHTNDAAIHLTPEQANRIANAVTNEQDLAALRTYHYGSPDIVESPAEWFTFDSGTGIITGFNWQAGREHVVIPWAIGGVPVVKLDCFLSYWDGNGVVSVITPKSVIAVNNSLKNCTALTSVDLRNVDTVSSSLQSCDYLTTVDLRNATTVNNSFWDCSALTSVDLRNVDTVSRSFWDRNALTTVDLPNATTVDTSLMDCNYLTTVDLRNATTVSRSLSSCAILTKVTFSGSPPAFDQYTFNNSPNVVVYVNNPHATGWGETFGGRPVVRLPLYADSYTLNGQTITEWPAAPDTTSPHTAWTSTLTPVDNAATITPADGNQPYLRSSSVTTVSVDWASYPTNGICRIALTLSGAGPYLFPTNNLAFVGEPELATNGYNRILIYRTADGPIGTAAILPGGGQ